MAGQKKISEKVPSLNGWGGVRSVQRRLERSATIVQNRETGKVTGKQLGKLNY